MHAIEPYDNWRNLYVAAEDEQSSFFGQEYSEFEYSTRIYNHLIHPQWDEIGSPTLFIKLLFTDYEEGFAIIEMIGEWNDCLHNDIMQLKRNIIDELTYLGINKFIIIGENVLNFHRSDDCYYEEWFEDVGEGWIAMLNYREHVLSEFAEANIDQYFVMGGFINEIRWRTYRPLQLFQKISQLVQHRLVSPSELLTSS